VHGDTSGNKDQEDIDPGTKDGFLDDMAKTVQDGFLLLLLRRSIEGVRLVVLGERGRISVWGCR
jgi:hypothetical protein